MKPRMVAKHVPWSYRCANPRCREFEFGHGPLCPSCRLAGGAGVFVAFVVGFLLKLTGLQ